MTDRPLDDGAFERALRATLDDLAPATTPASLRAAVGAVALRPQRGSADSRRIRFAVAGMAAAVLLAVAGLSLVAGLRLPTSGLAPVATPSTSGPAPSPSTFTYRVVAPDGSTASKAQVTAVSDVLAARLRAYGIGTFTSSASDDVITIDVPGTLGASSRDTIRLLLGATGTFVIGQPVAAPVDPGQRVGGPPLLTKEAITAATVGTDQTGNPTLDLTLSDPAAAVFRDATSAHIGEYLPIVLDGVAISDPVIQAEIPNGRVQIQFARDDLASPERLAAIIEAGPLPLPVEAVTP